MISYTPLWKTLIDKKKKKIDLVRDAGVNSRTLADMTSNKGDLFVSLRTINSICEYLDCRIEDVVEYIPDQNQDPQSQ